MAGIRIPFRAVNSTAESIEFEFKLLKALTTSNTGRSALTSLER
jgi:hypothetical protein